MKKIKKDFVMSYRLPILYLDDLTQIENIIKTELIPNRYYIETDEYELDSLTDISTYCKAC